MISTTQQTNYLGLAGALVVVLGYFKIQININDLAMLIGACATILAFILNFYHRYQKGDISALGIRLPSDENIG